MVEKPISGDAEQRRAQTRAARFQSGLPPEEGDVAPTREEPAEPDTGDEEGRDVA